MYDVTILTTAAYVNPPKIDGYIQNVLAEDGLIQEALSERGLKVTRTNWDSPNFDWTTTKTILFRTIWDYFERFDEFKPWLEQVSQQTTAINPIGLIWWNIDKHYLQDLKNRGINIVPTLYIEPGDDRSLLSIIENCGWNNVILKPAISGTARHTYKLNRENAAEYEHIFRTLIKKESMLLQPFINSIVTKGEVSHVVIGGKHSHSVLKKAKAGDFRVQDDFGGTLTDYQANEQEKQFAENVVNQCKKPPLYARVDVVWDNENKLALAELELIEPELWFRNKPEAAGLLAAEIENFVMGTST